MEKLRMTSPDLTNANIEKIAELFPAVITETVDGDGNPQRAVDFDLLRQELSDHIVEGPQERYQLDWPGKRAAAFAANAPIAKTLRPVRDESVDFDTTKNIFIEGDNLDALKLLQESYLGKVKLIYIDPPYNTGNDFVYEDDFAETTDEYLMRSGQKDDSGTRLTTNSESNGRFHSDWLSMMYPRIKLAMNLLSDDGVLLASVDYRENFNLRSLLDELFGRSQFVGEIYWESKTKAQNTKSSFDKLQPKAEMILVYTKKNKRRFNLVSEGKKSYPENDAQGAFRYSEVGQMAASGGRGRSTMVFPILGIEPNAGNQWKQGRDAITQYENRGDLLLLQGKPHLKVRPQDERNEITKPFWGLFTKEIGTAESAKSELDSLVGEVGFETVKPVELLRQLIFHTTDENDIVLDFFAGSGTTAHAVLAQNAKDGGGRRFIMVQVGETTASTSEAAKAGYSTYAQMSRERIRRAALKLIDESGLETSISDSGFRALKIDTTNMADVLKKPDQVDQLSLDQLRASILPGRTSEDLLFQVLLDWGLELSLSIVRETVDEREVFSVDDGALIACFSESVSPEVVRAIAERGPLRAVFRDDAFESDAARINTDQIFREVSPSTDVRTL